MTDFHDNFQACRCERIEGEFLTKPHQKAHKGALSAERGPPFEFDVAC